MRDWPSYRAPPAGWLPPLPLLLALPLLLGTLLLFSRSLPLLLLSSFLGSGDRKLAPPHLLDVAYPGVCRRIAERPAQQMLGGAFD